jgi:hypothetical protein
VSARFARATGELLPPFLQRPITTRMLVLYLDAVVLGSHAILVALGGDAEGRKQVLGLREGATENAAVTPALLEDLVARGLDTRPGLLVVIDGGKALAAAVTRVFGDRALIQRCQVHKRRNILEHLPQQDHGWVNARLSTAGALPDAGRAQREREALAAEWDVKCPGAAASLREGLEHTDGQTPADTETGAWVILAEDGTWHRPLTTLEQTVLQGPPAFQGDGTPLVLAGQSHSTWRKRIGNAVPPPTAEAVATAMLTTLIAGSEHLLLWTTFMATVWAHHRRLRLRSRVATV